MEPLRQFRVDGFRFAAADVDRGLKMLLDPHGKRRKSESDEKS
jgi:hypothetical protein